MSDDHLIDVGLREFFWLDFVFLAGTKQVVQKSDVEFEDFDELNQAPVGYIEFAVKVEGSRIAVLANFGNFSVVDIAGEFCRILVLFVLGLKCADANTVLFAENNTLDTHVADDLGPVTIVFL